jgi:FO synthase
MNESISRAAGADHGQELAPEKMDRLAESLDRMPKHRTTLYGDPAEERIAAAYRASPLTAVHNRHAREYKAAS